MLQVEFNLMVKDLSMGNSFHERTCLYAIYRHDAGCDGRGDFSIIVKNDIHGTTEILTSLLGGIPPVWVAPYTIIQLLTLSPMKRAPHVPIQSTIVYNLILHNN